MTVPPPVGLTIAGSDPSGGAGIQADLKTFSALGVYGTSVLTALTAQNTRTVTGVQLVPPAFVAEQLGTLAADIRIDAVKIGMLATADVARVVAAFLREHPRELVVLDPVMVATSGDPLLTPDAVAALRELVPLVSLITPNLPEAAVLLQEEPATDLDGMRRQARRLHAAGAQRVLLKGGHLIGGRESVDVLVGPGQDEVLTAARIHTSTTHGTGCSLSSAIAALQARHRDWSVSVPAAKRWLTAAIAAGERLQVGHGRGPVHHFHQLWTS